MFQNLLVPEDIDTALGFWKQVIDDQKPVTGEFRFKYQHEDLTDEDRELGGRWVSNLPETSRNSYSHHLYR